MGKSKRSMNPADALRKQQRKRELKKNKEDRKRARETVLAKKDIDKVKQDISRLEHLAGSGQLDKNGQTRLDTLRGELGKIEKAKKATGLTGAQAAFAARMEEHDKKHEGDSRKLVFDPKRGAFVPAKKKDTKQTTSEQQGEHEEEGSSDSSSESDSDLDSDSDSEKESGNEDESEIEGDIPPPSAEKEEEQPREITESDDEYEIPLPPGPPPPRPFAEQFIPMQAMQSNMVHPPPPPPPPGVPVYRGTYGAPPPPPPLSNAQFGQRIPPPPPPIYYGYNPQHQHPPPPPPIIRPPQHHIARPSTSYTAPVSYPNKEITQTEQSSKPAPTVATISAEPQLRDLQKELLGFVPAALRRKQANAQKKAALPKGARPNINAAPTIDDDEEDNDYNE